MFGSFAIVDFVKFGFIPSGFYMSKIGIYCFSTLLVWYIGLKIAIWVSSKRLSYIKTQLKSEEEIQKNLFKDYIDSLGDEVKGILKTSLKRTILSEIQDGKKRLVELKETNLSEAKELQISNDVLRFYSEKSESIQGFNWCKACKGGVSSMSNSKELKHIGVVSKMTESKKPKKRKDTRSIQSEKTSKKNSSGSVNSGVSSSDNSTEEEKLCFQPEKIICEKRCLIRFLSLMQVIGSDFESKFQ